MRVFHKEYEHRHWLEDYGFDKCSRTVLGQSCQYETCVHSKDDLYCIWVGINFDALEVYIYVEYECGGEVCRYTVDLSDVDVDREEALMQVLDDAVSYYVENY